MRADGNNFNHFPENKLTKLANSMQIKRMLSSCLGNWGLWRRAQPGAGTQMNE